MASRKPRILVLLQEYPQISETYIANELEVLWPTCDIRIVARMQADFAYRDHFPFSVVARDDPGALMTLAAEFRPDIVHAHYLHNAIDAHMVARELGIGFTMRLHSFDVLRPLPKVLQRAVAAINTPQCLGVLTFPFTIERLVEAGIARQRLHAAPPVLRIDRFLNREPNGDAIMNTGAALPKKEMETFIDLAARMPERRFNLYAMGYDVGTLKAYNAAKGRRVNIVRPLQPREMPAEYKKHEWLVYTASARENTVGWPMAIAEAQASGVGVLMQDIRPDLREYVGAPGYMFRTVEEARAIVSRPFPAERRERGFEHAQRWGLRHHIGTLTSLWNRGLTEQGRLRQEPKASVGQTAAS